MARAWARCTLSCREGADILRGAEAPFLIRRRPRLWVNLLSLALLFAQFGLAVHASTHLGNDPDTQSTRVCDYCLTSSALQNIGGGDASFEVTVTVAHHHAIDVTPVHSIAAIAFTAFRSRAPPQIL